MNGQKGIIVQWDENTERYELRLDINNDVKKVKPGNIKIQPSEGWEEQWDEHLQRRCYVDTRAEKVSVANIRAEFGEVVEGNTEELEEEEDYDEGYDGNDSGAPEGMPGIPSLEFLPIGDMSAINAVSRRHRRIMNDAAEAFGVKMLEIAERGVVDAAL